MNLKYDTLKSAVIETIHFRLVASSALDDFLKIHRRVGESLVCLSITWWTTGKHIWQGSLQKAGQ